MMMSLDEKIRKKREAQAFLNHLCYFVFSAATANLADRRLRSFSEASLLPRHNSTRGPNLPAAAQMGKAG